MQKTGRLFRRETPRRDARWKAGVAVATASFALAGALAFTINPSSAAGGGMPKAFANESDQGAYPGFNAGTLADLSPKCPQGIAATPGSQPSNKFLNTALSSSFAAGGTVHYSYIDNPNFASDNYTIQDCVAVYPESTFSAADFDPITGVLLPASGVSKSDLNKGVQIDGAAFSGVFDSTGSTYFSWTSPGNLTGGQWVCNFARDIATGHGGGGNRKVEPTCYQVPKQEVSPYAPTLEAGACGQQDQLTIPSQEGVTYYLDGSQSAISPGKHGLTPGAHTVTAFDGEDQVGSWPFNASTVEDPEDCKTPITADAVTLSKACGRADQYTVPNDADVDYYIGNNKVVPGTYNLPQGVSVTIDAVAKDPANDHLGGTKQWTFTGTAIVACSQERTPPPPPLQETTTTTEAPTTTTTAAPTTTTALPELPFTPEPEIVTTTTMAPAPELAFTGSNSGYLAMMGLLLVGFGGLLFAGSNRKRRTTS